MFNEFGNTIDGSKGTFDNIGDYIAVVLNTALVIGMGLSLVAVILSGIKYITSKGDVKAAITAKQALSGSLIALLLTFGAYTIVKLILGSLGVDTPVSSPVPRI